MQAKFSIDIDWWIYAIVLIVIVWVLSAMSVDIVVEGSGDFLPAHTLPQGTMLRDYRIDRVLGEGGFGIVYLATDAALQRQVAVKEYLPSSMAAPSIWNELVATPQMKSSGKRTAGSRGRASSS